MKTFISGAMFLIALAASAVAQEAPAPHRAPRVPVNRELLAQRAAVPASRDVQGQALILDGEKLRVGDADLRLFGIVPPQLSASFGPQARSALDSLVTGAPVMCHIRDRDHDGRLLATCHTANGGDLALELLRRGLAVTARGSIADTELAQPYIDAEQAAESQHIGLWSATLPAAASVTATAPVTVAKPIETPPPPPPVEIKKDEPKKDEKHAAAPVVAPVIAPLAVPGTPAEPSAAPGFFARYQILIAALLMLTTALGILGTLGVQRRAEKYDEMKALAAALRGELLAARAVCLTRITTIVSEEDDHAAIWPRLRSTLYQAYVGRLGWLGAELARQVASIYGQASDYAAYYNIQDGSHAATPKRQALQMLVGHIEEVLPRLAGIEATGQRPPPRAGVPALKPIRMTAVAGSPSMKAITASTKAVARPAARVAETPRAVVAKDDMSPHDVKPHDEKPVAEDVTSPPKAETTFTTYAAVETALESLAGTVSPPALPASSVAAGDEGAGKALPPTLWDSLRRFAQDRFAKPAAEAAAEDDLLPDYAALIEQDMANISFGDEDHEPFDPHRKSGVG